MPKFKLYTGINIQYPISREILSGRKTIETRTYPIPEKYLNNEMVLIETPGKKKEFPARAVAIIKFTKCFKYSNATEFYRDRAKHLVDKESKWAWKDKPKYGWKVEVVRILPRSVDIPKNKGIVYTKEISV